METPFNFAFGTKPGFFGWLEEGQGEGEGPQCEEGVWLKGLCGEGRGGGGGDNKFRLERFGKAMSGSCAWDPPGGLLNGLSPLPLPLAPKLTIQTAGIDWSTLLARSTIVDVGGRIGLTSMELAKAFGHLRFMVQDQGMVVDMGVKVQGFFFVFFLSSCPLSISFYLCFIDMLLFFF